MPVPLFDLGKVAVSPTALEALETNPEDLATLLDQHGTGDWPELDGFARTVNEQAIFGGGRILTYYTLRNGQRLSICTESARQGPLTTVIT